MGFKWFRARISMKRKAPKFTTEAGIYRPISLFDSPPSLATMNGLQKSMPAQSLQFLTTTNENSENSVQRIAPQVPAARKNHSQSMNDLSNTDEIEIATVHSFSSTDEENPPTELPSLFKPAAESARPPVPVRTRLNITTTVKRTTSETDEIEI